MSNQSLYNLKEDFLKEWPITRLESMSIEEYTNLEKSSFCYWVESLTTELGSIWGGSAYKFGVFRRDNLDKGDYEKSGRTAKGNYSWYSKYGIDKDTAYDVVRSYIIQIAKLSESGNLKDIESIDLGYAYKWKIAFLYGDYNIINLFKHNAVLICAKYLGYDGDDKSHAALNEYILNKKVDKDFYDFAKELWAVFDNVNPTKAEFEKWLKTKNELESGKINSYLRAIDILRNEFKVQIYEEDEIEILEDLYEDLKQHQKEINGKYFYNGAKSYGEGGFYSAAVGTYLEFLKTRKGEATTDINNLINMDNNNELNQIFFGPPGTGKTYTTIDKVVEICEPNLYSKNHKSNKEIYDNLIEDGRVVFTTFHQSMSYEDFIEGIKPVKPEEDDIYLKYDVEPGILRNIASNAKKIKISKNSVNWDTPRYFKMSIGGKNRLDLHDWCIENSTIALGWGGNKDLSEFSKIKDWKTYRDEFNNAFPDLVQESRYNIQSTYSFLQMDINDIVIISKGNNIIDAIGIVKGEYFFNDDNAIDYNHFRKVEWISTNMGASPEKFLKKKISQQSIYEFYSQDIKKDVLKELTGNKDEIAKPYVLVIDEINRGNVSAIFGELITLIEEDKRIGAENELSITLPYSKIKFGIPPNLYIIGTMNTADRSVEALDTALRRRFTFEEMLPKPELLKDKGEKNSGHVGDINLEELLKTINERIEALVDRDHTIGHAFFMDVDSMQSLRKVFTNKVIPLLQEYFYGDYAKMEMVIGPNFFNQDKLKSKVIFAVQNDEVEITTGSYQLVTIADDTEFEEALKRLLASK